MKKKNKGFKVDKIKPKKIIAKQLERFDTSLKCGLYHIKNKYVFDTSKSKAKSDDEHLYVVFVDKNNNVDRVVETTHLFEKEKVKKIEKGQLKVFQFAGQNYPSGVSDTYYQIDIDKKPFQLSSFRKSPYTIKPSQANEIFNFAKRKRR